SDYEEGNSNRCRSRRAYCSSKITKTRLCCSTL
ncbi:hypothetical protein A5868_001530, partial [Enterococcus sp. 12F9_DIV0723]